MGNIRYCRQCGHALSDESRFCEYCGAKVERETPRTQRPQEQGVFSPRGDGSAQEQSARRESGTGEQSGRRVTPQNAQPQTGGGNIRRRPESGEQSSRRVTPQNAQPRTGGENISRRPESGEQGSRRGTSQNAQLRRGAENTRRQSGVSEQRGRISMENAQPRTGGENAHRQSAGGGQGSRRIQQDVGERRTRYHQERLQGSWEESWNRELPEEDERRITPVQYLLLGLIAILIAALVALGLFWMKGRSGNRNTQDGGNVQVAQTETAKTTAGEAGGGDSVITILDGDGQVQSETTKQTSAAETPKDQNAVTEKTTERTTEKQTEKITEKQTEAVTIPTEQPQTQAQSGSYILPQSSERLLTDSDVDGMSYDDMQMAINEIYARHGRKFSSQSVQSYFDGQSWYQGTVEPDDFSDSVFSQIEGENVLFLLKKMGIE